MLKFSEWFQQRNENADPWVDCPRCDGMGGEPGENFGDHGWHPCFLCGELGKVRKSVADRLQRDEMETKKELIAKYGPSRPQPKFKPMPQSVDHGNIPF
jgi:hypothetical protein